MAHKYSCTLRYVLILVPLLLFTRCEDWIQDAPQILRAYDSSQLQYHIAPIANTYGFLFYSSEDWQAVISSPFGEEDIPDPPTIFPEQGQGSGIVQSIHFTVPENTTEYPRTFYLTLVAGEKNLTVIIEQRADLGILQVTPTDILLPATGGTQEIQIKSNKDWFSTSENHWYTLSQTSGVGNQEATVTVSAPHNKTVFKTAEHQYQSDLNTCTVTVSQHALDWTLPTNLKISHDGPQTFPFTVTSSLPWTITGQTQAQWYTIETTGHPESASAIENHITFHQNTGGTRTAKLTLANTNNDKLTFTITQHPDLQWLFPSYWNGTAKVDIMGLTQIGSIDLTILDHEHILVRGYTGHITYISKETIQFTVYIDKLEYGGFTGHNVKGNFIGYFSEDLTSLSGTLTGSATIIGINVSASGTWQASL